MVQLSSSPRRRAELTRRSVRALLAVLLRFLRNFYTFCVWYGEGLKTSLTITIFLNKSSIFPFKFNGHAYFTLEFFSAHHSHDWEFLFMCCSYPEYYFRPQLQILFYLQVLDTVEIRPLNHLHLQRKRSQK